MELLPELWSMICLELNIHSLYNLCISYKPVFKMCSQHEFWINYSQLHNIKMLNQENLFKYFNEFIVNHIIRKIFYMRFLKKREVVCICNLKINSKNKIKNIINNYTIYHNYNFKDAIYIDSQYIEFIFKENPSINICINDNINQLLTTLCEEKIINHINYIF